MQPVDLQLAAPRYVLARWPHVQTQHQTSLLIIGGGAAGLAAALYAANYTDVLVLVRGALPASNSSWAQGGIAAALDSGDSPEAHIADTLIAGVGLSDRVAVEVLAEAAPALMCELAELGVPLERAPGGFELGLEGGHSHRRIVHAGDATGWALTSTLAEHARQHPRITIVEGMQVVDLLDNGERITGALARDQQSGWHCISANATILATGGAGALFGLTSNQPDALGEGIALAYRAGAAIADMEFVQFHPTVLRTRSGYGFLISEAVRGEGAKLLDARGDRFMPAFDPRAELAPRDVVARGIFEAMRRNGSDHVLLDVTHLSSTYLERRFPTIYARCRAEGFDPSIQPVPIAPAAHYLMGGICTDLNGATNLPGLYAAGECACTGVHGANRLASNSLLECLVFGRRAAAAALDLPRLSTQRHVMNNHQPATAIEFPPDWRQQLTQTMRNRVALIRNADGLNAARAELARLPLRAADHAETITATNAALTAQLIATAALLREESRGAHSRSDFPTTSELWQVHVVQQRNQAPRAVTTVAELEVDHA